MATAVGDLMRALLGTSASSQPGAMCHRRPLPDRHWRRCSGSTLLAISRIAFGGRGSSAGISAGINAGLPYCQTARIHTSSNGVHRRRARPICGGAPWRHGRLSQARRTRCCLPPHALGSPPQAIGDRCRWGMCADGRSADISDRPFGQRVDTSESLGIELPIPSAAPPLSRDFPLDHVESRMRRRSVGRPSHGRCSFNDGRTVDPPVFPQGNPGTPVGQLSPDRAVVRGQPVDQPGSCQVVCT